jgi:hypothetical protein
MLADRIVEVLSQSNEELSELLRAGASDLCMHAF